MSHQTLMKGIEMVTETSVIFNQLTWLIAQEDYIIFEPTLQGEPGALLHGLHHVSSYYWLTASILSLQGSFSLWFSDHLLTAALDSAAIQKRFLKDAQYCLSNPATQYRHVSKAPCSVIYIIPLHNMWKHRLKEVVKTGQAGLASLSPGLV
jgi:hypothetical protein